MTPIEEILNELQSLTALFTDLDKVSQAQQKPTIPIECLQKVVYEKLDRIRTSTGEL